MTGNGRPTVLNILPHPGGGAERMLNVLERAQPGYRHLRTYLSPSSRPLAAAPAIPRRWPKLIAQSMRADIVHAHGDVAAMLVVPLLAARPSAMSTHGLSFLRRAHGSRLDLAQRSMRTVLGTVSRTVCTSATEMRELEALVPDGDAARLRLVLNGVPVPELDEGERAAARRELGVEDAVVGVFLGGLEPHKDPITAARAARMARERGVPLILLVAGEGTLAEQIAIEGGSAVRMLGFRDDPERLLQAADLFLMTSEREAVSCALLEAMSFGVAAIASDARGNPEGIGDAGVMVPVGDAEAFASSIERLANDVMERRRLGMAGRQRVIEHFTADRLARQMDAVYAEVLAESLRD